MFRACRQAKCVVAATLVLASSSALAQWTTINLRPANASSAGIRHGSSEGLCGGVEVDGLGRATMWTPVNYQRIDLTPPNATYSNITGMGDGQQVGWCTFPNGQGAACLWYGTAESLVYLDPPGSNSASLYGVHEGQQVGSMRVNGRTHAALWQGSAESRLDLHPAGATESVAIAVFSGRQAGWATINGVIHAGFWYGSASTWVDLNPSEAAYSLIYAMDREHQAGSAGFGVQRATVWSGTASSRQYLHPPAADWSICEAVCGDVQAGKANLAGVSHASFWQGTPESWIDLHVYLPPGYESSLARGVWRDGESVCVAGMALQSVSQKYDVIVWTLRPGCDTDFDGDGVSDSMDVSYMIHAIAGGPNPTGKDLDFTHDGNVDADDPRTLLNAIAGAECP